jgi:tetratricopeptide (TPR) repeat protein
MEVNGADRMPSVAEVQNPSEPTAWESLAGYLRRPAILLASLGGVTLVLYSGTFFFEFVWDDWPQIANNPLIRSWHNLPRAFGSDLWYHVARQQVYYRPLFVVWSMLNFSLFGLHPWGWHLGAVLAHVGAVLAIFWLVRKLAALIFALHPIHIEPAVWISAASDSMVTMFAALAFGTFLIARESGGRHCTGWRIVSLGLLTCALLTKEMAVTFAALVGIYVWLHPAQERASRRWRLRAAGAETIPYALVTLAYVLARKHALLQATGTFDTGHGMLDVLRTLPLVLCIYLEKLLLPVGLTPMYYTPYVTSGIFIRAIAPAALLGVVVAAIWYWYRCDNDAAVAFAGWWLLLGLAPALYLRNFGNGDFVRDRYMYLPSIGFAILAAKALRRLPAMQRWSARTVQGCSIAALCLFYTFASLSQQVQWGSDLLLLQRGQQLYPGNPNGLVRLAAEYSARGANDRAVELAQEAERQHPEYVYSALAVAETNIRAGHFDEGRMWLGRFLSVNQDFAQSLTGMATLAGLYGRLGDYDRALGLCGQILAKEPNLYSALYNCGNIQLLAGNYSGAEQLLSRAVRLEPLEAGPRHFLGRALLEDGRNQDAQPYLQAAVNMDSKVWDYHYWLAVSLERSGNISGARAEYQQTLQLNQSSSEAKLRLAGLEGK